MRNWYSIDFTPTSVMNKNRYYNCVTDLIINGKSFEKWVEDARKEGYNDAVMDMRLAVKPKEID